MIIGFKYNSIYYIGLLLAVSGCLTGAAPALGQSGSKLEIDHSTFDFGRIPGPCTVEMRSWIRSTGLEALEIADVKTGCACISSFVGKRMLAPGDSAELVLRWSVRDTAGTKTRQVYVFSNAGTGVARIGLSTMIGGFGEAERFDLIPAEIRSIPGRASSPRQSLKLGNRLEEPCGVNPVMIGNGIELEVPDSVAAGDLGQIYVEIDQEVVNQSFESSFTLEITGQSGYNRRITVPVTVGDHSYKPTYVRTLKKK